MALKDLAVPALCVFGTLMAIKGCDKEKQCSCARSYTPQPAPINQVEQASQQTSPRYYQEVLIEPQYRGIIRRRVIRRTIKTVPATYYYEY